MRVTTSGHSFRRRPLKRAFDILVATVALALVGLPMLLIAVAVRLDSPGPVFYRQERVGRFGRTFRIHKFRTMGIGADRLGLSLTVGDDPRITRVGRWLRRHRLDELPQFLDVLYGDMSIIGPRPEVPCYVAHYPAELRERALSVRPGISDPTSLEYSDEGALLAGAGDPEREYITVILPRKLAGSVAYAERATLLSDLGVLLRTIKVLFNR